MRQDLFAVVTVGFAFFLIFSAFNSQGFIEITVLRNIAQRDPSSGLSEHSGYYSLAIIYFTFTLANIIAPSCVAVLGPRLAQAIGGLLYTLFLAAFVVSLNAVTLYTTSALLGVGAALIWTGNGAYLVQISRDGKMARNSGIMWGMLQGSLIAGAFFLLFVLKGSDVYSSYRLMYSVFAVVGLIGSVLCAVLPNYRAKDANRSEDVERLLSDDGEPTDEPLLTSPIIPSRTFKEELYRMMALAKTKHMLIFSVVFMYSGIETSFYTGVYTACLSAFTALSAGNDSLIAFNIFAMGVGQIVGGMLFGTFSSYHKMSRSKIVMLGMTMHIIAFMLAFLNLPMDSPLRTTSAIGYMEPSVAVSLLTALLLGFSDSCWQTQIYTLLGTVYEADSSSAFAIFKFFQSLAACAAFNYGSVLLLHWQLLILALGAAISSACFFYVDNAATFGGRIE